MAIDFLYVQWVKRPLDLLLAISLFFLSSPIIFAVFVFLAATNRGRGIFRQQRIGRGEVPFIIYKFRTLEDDGHTPVWGGRLLRKTSLDELPQLWNVLRGEMSLIGPRPLYAEYLQYYSTQHRRRHEVRPGITGLAQVNGRNTLTWSERFDYDVQYVAGLGPRLDLEIVLKTIRVLFAFRAADFHQQDLAPFKGYE
ncbi:MAG: sugar transferase [Bacteroidota bacterium]